MRAIRITALIGLLVFAGAALAAHHVNGTWALSVDLGGGQGGDATFVLKEGEGGVLTGTYSGAVGSADVTGKVTGNEVEFSFNSDQVGEISYKGTVDGDTIEGACTYGALGSGTFKGKKSE
jgi:hypothetical protein